MMSSPRRGLTTSSRSGVSDVNGAPAIVGPSSLLLSSPSQGCSTFAAGGGSEDAICAAGGRGAGARGAGAAGTCARVDGGGRGALGGAPPPATRGTAGRAPIGWDAGAPPRGATGIAREEAGAPAAFGAGAIAPTGRTGAAGAAGAPPGSGGPIGPNPIIVGDRGRTPGAPGAFGIAGGGTVIGDGMLLGSSNDGPSVARVRPPPSSSSHGFSSASFGTPAALEFGSLLSSFNAELGSRQSRRVVVAMPHTCGVPRGRENSGQLAARGATFTGRAYRKPSRLRSLRALWRETSTRLPVERQAT